MKTFLVPLALLFCISKATAQVPLYNSYPAAAAVIYLDFDGHVVNGTNWNIDGPVYCGPSNLSGEQMAEIFNRVAEDYRPFNLNVTTDSAVYEAAPIDQRMRVVFTITSAWYGVAGGVAYTNSFSWANNTPCFVFTALHKYNIKNIAEAASHEAGHTLGLRHQAQYDSTCRKVSDYNSGTGSGVVGWAPIMGVGYYRNTTTWHHGPNPFGCNNEQDDLAIITGDRNGFGYRPDEDTAADFATAPLLNTEGNALAGDGLIATNKDTDLFQIPMPASGPLRLDVSPYSIAENSEGSNLDVQVQLYNKNRQLIGTYNPAEALGVRLDTTLPSGTYYIAVSGGVGPFASNYASLGAYVIRGAVPAAGPVAVHTLQLRGSSSGVQQQLNWILAADAPVTGQVLERSEDGAAFVPVATLSPDARHYTAVFSKPAQYRLQVLFSYNRLQYSNHLALRTNAPATPQLYTNLIHSNTLQVSSPAVYGYAITDVAGQVLQKGTIKAGANTIIMPYLRAGLYIISFQNGTARTAQKFLRE